MTRQDRPWYREYDEFGIPETVDYPDEPVHGLLYTAAEEYPDMGLVQPGVEMNYPEVVDKVERLATALSERGVGKGDRVATVLPTSVQFVLSTYAVSRAGGVNIPNDFLEAEDDLVYRLRRGKPDVLLGIDQQRDLILDLKEELGLDHVILTKIDDFAGSTERDGVKGVEWLTDVIEATEPDPPDLEFDVENDVHTLLFTGGTTGRPKGCMLSHRNMTANAIQNAKSQSRIADMIRGKQSILNALPLYHAYGYSVANTLVYLGVRQLLVPDPRDTDTMVGMIDEYDPLVMMGVPTQFMEIVEEEIESQRILGISGSAPLASETQKEFRQKSNTGIAQGYGLSEMSPVTHFNVRGLLNAISQSDDDVGFDMPSIGVPVPDTEVKLRDVDTGDEISVEEAIENEREAEMLVKGPQRMIGYLGDDRTAFDDEGYVETGDVVKVDPMGRFYVVDRVKDMINVSGLKVYSEEVDEVLHRHPEVRRGATVGVPDPERPGSERVKVFVETDEGAELTADGLKEFLEGRIAKHAMPSEVEFVDEIPLTPIGKTDKKKLRETEN